GLNRFASWVNTNKSQTQVSDPNSRELNEMWPGGRFNHYWFDLNRDWLPAQHIESQNRLQFFHQWKPNIFTDHHEMGSNSSFFFQPGVPSRVNPNTPLKNQQLTAAIASFHAKFLDSIGSIYFSKEGYDDFYYGKGSTYPDINGGVGILFEQASSRGHAQETDNGLLTFPFTIRNQFTTALSTLEAAKNLRAEMLSYQRDFFKEVLKEADANPVKAYVFNYGKDMGKLNEFLTMLARHQINIQALAKDITIDNKKFIADKAFVVPLKQQQYKLVKAIFEKTLEYKDSLFYDVTAWTMPLAFGLPYAEFKGSLSEVTNNSNYKNSSTGFGDVKIAQSNVGYVIKWDDFFAPKLLYALQKKGINVKVATQKFSASTTSGSEEFEFGSLIIPVQSNNNNVEQLNKLINTVEGINQFNLFALKSGLSTSGIDLGSPSYSNVKTPRIMLFAGTGTSAPDAGEIWHLLDTRFHIPVTIVDVERFATIGSSKYNVIIMPSGSYINLNKDAQDKLKAWITAGGTLIATEDAVKFLATNGFTKITFKEPLDKRDSTIKMPYYLKNDEQRAKEMAGSIFEAKLDLTHPICYGYHEPTISIFKSSNLFMNPNAGAYDNPVTYTANPLQSGYLYRGYKEKIKNTAVINIDAVGKGKIISMVDNLNFRAFWLGTSKMFMNAVFFGDLIKL
ncbi:MAG: zinc carboxypeptidase, partial [Chitinophagaceae bacterium]|nr:zinc carboxypeptidase [Chitinophagaceae bacterium]